MIVLRRQPIGKELPERRGIVRKYLWGHPLIFDETWQKTIVKIDLCRHDRAFLLLEHHLAPGNFLNATSVDYLVRYPNLHCPGRL
jgi:hypothetical protein